MKDIKRALYEATGKNAKKIVQERNKGVVTLLHNQEVLRRHLQAASLKPPTPAISIQRIATTA
jgi:hypothetical protein